MDCVEITLFLNSSSILFLLCQHPCFDGLPLLNALRQGQRPACENVRPTQQLAGRHPTATHHRLVHRHPLHLHPTWPSTRVGETARARRHQPVPRQPPTRQHLLQSLERPRCRLLTVHGGMGKVQGKQCTPCIHPSFARHARSAMIVATSAGSGVREGDTTGRAACTL